MYYCYFYVVQVHQLGPSTLLPLRKNRGARGGLVVVDDEAAAAHREAVSRLIYSAKANQASWVGHSTHTYTHSHSTSSSSSGGVQSALLKEQQ